MNDKVFTTISFQSVFSFTVRYTDTFQMDGLHLKTNPVNTETYLYSLPHALAYRMCAPCVHGGVYCHMCALHLNLSLLLLVDYMFCECVKFIYTTLLISR